MFKNYNESKLSVRWGSVIFCLCVLSVAAYGQQLQWFNYPGYFPRKMATDAQGNVYVTGRDKSSGAEDVEVFIRKYAPSGTLIWERLSTSRCCNYRVGQGIALDAQGNVYVAGDFFFNIRFDTVELQSSYSDVFLAKYTADGTLLWARSAYSSTDFEGQEFVSDLEIDANNNPVIIGNFEREMRLDSTLIVAADDAPPNKMSVYMLRANADGIWQSLARVADLHYAYALEVDASGNLFVAGSKRTHTHEHYYTDPQEGDVDTLFIDMFDMGIAKHNAAGVLQWRNLYGAPNLVEGLRDMALDDAGNVYVAGSDNDPLAPRTAPDRHEVFMKTDNNGVQQWVRYCQNINYSTGNIASFGNVAVDNDQNPVFGGVFKGTVTVDSQTFTSISGSDLLFIRYDASGNLVSALPFSGTGDEDLVDMVFNADNTLYLTGFIPAPPAAPAITAFALIDAVTDQQDGLVLDRGQIDLAALPNKHINIRALMRSETAGSVVFVLNNREARIDNAAPFALWGDDGGDYNGKVLPVGDYTLSATAWTEANAGGAKGPTYTIQFKVINSAAAPWAEGVKVYPNPVQSNVRLSAAEAQDENVAIQILDLYGQLKYEGEWKAGEEAKEIDLTALSKGVYILKTISATGENSRRIIKE